MDANRAHLSTSEQMWTHERAASPRYGLNAWASSRAVSAYQWCFTHGVVENGHVYCDMTRFGQSR
jgi:hypothetical protein